MLLSRERLQRSKWCDAMLLDVFDFSINLNFFFFKEIERE